jgi:4'-phosphopantetheinyl transferase
MSAAPQIRFSSHAGGVPALGDEVHVWHLAGAGTRAPAVAQASRRALEALLCAYAGLACAPPIERGAQGKPFAPALPDLHFNLSHAGADVLLALARCEPLGVDLERIDRRVAIDAIAQRHFASAEAAALAELAPARRREAFIDLWTRKEAVLKAIGAGLSYGLQRVEFEVGVDGAIGALHGPLAQGGAAVGWQLHGLAPAPGLVGALAWRGAPRRVRGFALPATGIATLAHARTSL